MVHLTLSERSQSMTASVRCATPNCGHQFETCKKRVRSKREIKCPKCRLPARATGATINNTGDVLKAIHLLESLAPDRAKAYKRPELHMGKRRNRVHQPGTFVDA